MASFERINSPDLRRDTRFATAFDAQIIVDDRRLSVIVGDISSGGALVKGDKPLALGSKIRLRAAGLDMVARVMGVHDGLCGISFAHPVNALAIVRDNISYFREMRTRRGDATLPSQAWENWPIAP